MEVMEFQLRYFKSWKVTLWKCCTQYASKFGKLSNGHRTGKGVFIPNPKKGNTKECSSYHTIALISYASKIMFKILQARLQQYMNWELLDVQGRFRKSRGIREKNCQHLLDHRKKQDNSKQKHIYFCFIDYSKAFGFSSTWTENF